MWTACRCASKVPSLIVQPLLENAVYHGIEMLPAGGAVSIVGKRVDDMLQIEVRNPIPAQAGYGEREGNRMALENIRQRLELAWPGRARRRNRADGRGVLRPPHLSVADAKSLSA